MPASRHYMLLVVLLLLLGACTAGRAGEVVGRVEPGTLGEGETGQLTLSASSDLPVLLKLPTVEGVTWLNRQASTQQVIINGAQTLSATYVFTATKAGTIRWPALEVRSGGKQELIQLPPTVVKPAGSDPQLQLRLTFDGAERPPARLYVGQELGIAIRLCIGDDLAARIARTFYQDPAYFFPKPEIPHVTYRDFSKENQYDPHFRYEEPKDELVDRQSFRVIRYFMKIRPQAPGPLSGTIRQTVLLAQPQPARDPFGFTPMRAVAKPVKVDLPPIEVLALPADPQPGAVDLGLVGTWQVTLALSRDHLKVGEDLTLTLTARGAGDPDAARVPELSLPGFNVYPPETTRTSGEPDVVTVRWVLVPKDVGATLPPLVYSTFDAGSGQYQHHRFTLPLTLAPGERPAGGSSQVTLPPASATAAPAVPATHVDTAEILYLKPLAVAVPTVPGRRAVMLAVALVVLGPMLWVLVLALVRRAQAVGGASWRRRQAAAAARATWWPLVERATPAERPALVSTHVLPYLLALYDLPPGTTLGQLAAQERYAELATCLRAAEEAAYRPPTEATPGLDPARLLASLKRITVACVMVALVAGGLVGALLPTAQAADAAAPDSRMPTQRVDSNLRPESPAEAYARGEFAAAAGGYSELLAARPHDAALWYNLGNCAFAQGQYAQAVADYERARRLAPRDADIRQNLATARRRLPLLPGEGAASVWAPLLAGRDRLLPQEWLVVAALGWVWLWAMLAWRRWRRQPVTALTLAPGLLILFALWVWAAQLQSTYRDGQALVVVADAPLYRLPTAAAGAPQQTLASGQPLQLEEQRGDGWYRVRFGDTEGWLPARTVAKVWE